MRITVLFYLLGLQFILYSQSFELSEIPVHNSTGELINPYIGGLRAGQFSNADLNLDGEMDLVIFDRVGAVVTPLIREGDRYRYDPSFIGLFPPALNWLLMKDYNGDGIQDIFCSPTTIGIPGIEVWKGSVENGKLQYNLMRFPDRDFDILYIPLGRGFTQLYVSVIDLPDIVDIDNDGDLDIVAFEPSGSFVFYYKNITVENSLEDTLIFELGDQCFGKFLESGFSEEIELSNNELECASFLKPDGDILVANRHSGSTITLIDPDGDGLKDVLLGDISYNGLVELINTGTPQSAWMTDQNVRWPKTDDPLTMELFLSAFQVDYLDQESLIVTTNDRTNGQTVDFVRRYEFDEQSSNYQLVESETVVDQMIFHGQNSRPIFFDYNGDGLIDILVGSNGTNNDGVSNNPRLVLYENNGTESSPRYVVKQEDFLQFSQFSNTSRWFAPSIGDIDGDNDIDLIIGDDTGQLYFVENQSGLENVFNYKNPVYPAFGIKLSAFATPTIFDFNEDGLSDLIIGEQNFNSVEGRLGSLTYYQNIGETESAMFDNDETAGENDGAFGNIYLRDENFVSNFSSLAFYENGEQLNLIFGNQAGKLWFYEDVKGLSPQDSFELTYDLSDEINVGYRVTPDLQDIDNDGFLEIVLGNIRGGISLYDSDIVSIESVDSVPQIQNDNRLLVEGNLIQSDLKAYLVEADNSRVNWVIYNVEGQIVRSIENGNDQISLDISELYQGIYIITANNGSNIYSSRFVKI